MATTTTTTGNTAGKTKTKNVNRRLQQVHANARIGKEETPSDQCSRHFYEYNSIRTRVSVCPMVIIRRLLVEFPPQESCSNSRAYARNTITESLARNVKLNAYVTKNVSFHELTHSNRRRMTFVLLRSARRNRLEK